MAEVSSTTSTSSTSSTSSAATNVLAGNYDLFLTLLTTQVQNQDPLDPLDSSEYTNQLVQYSAVEQSIQTNEHLENLLALVQSDQASSYVSYLGSEITASGDTTMLNDGSATWNYKLSEAATGTVEIRNSLGALVYSEDVELSAGSSSYTWNGATSQGGTASDGPYSISFEVFDSGGRSEAVSTEISGVVDGVDLSTGSAFLKVGAVEVPVSAVQSVAIGS